MTTTENLQTRFGKRVAGSLVDHQQAKLFTANTNLGIADKLGELRCSNLQKDRLTGALCTLGSFFAHNNVGCVAIIGDRDSVISAIDVAIENDELIKHTEWCAPATSNETENEIGGRDAGLPSKPKKTASATGIPRIFDAVNLRTYKDLKKNEK
jgi:hypothetical protein